MRAVRAVFCQMIAKDRRAVTSLEYGLLGLLVFLVIITSVTALGTSLKPIFSSVANGL
jgi:pilus assembly protein Flp/PilA